MSTRRGGAGVAPFDSNNLALHADDPAVAVNRQRFADRLGAMPVWLHHVHGTDVVRLTRPGGEPLRADASLTTVPGVACAVLVADCLPVLFRARGSEAVAAAHAGWRGLSAGVLWRTVEALCQAAHCAPEEVEAWLGPCIGPRQFEVGEDVLAAFDHPVDAPPGRFFTPRRRIDGQMRWLADLPALARRQLHAAGVERCSGDGGCTVEETSAFFSFRRDGRLGPTGRMAAGIAIALG
jgi:polyphenol oxidase